MIQNQGIPSDGQPNAQDTANNYMFNGKKYGSLEDAQVAKQSYDKEQKDRFLAFAADYYSVGGDRDKLNSLYASNSGLSQMSNAEKDFIVDRYAKSNPYDRKAYDPSSIVDQYLSSVGLPSSKELNNYRKAYYNYASGGGIKDNYASFASDPDAIKWMQDQWKKDTAVGINGDIVTTDGKAIKYGDTLLDDELKANGLMPSDQVEKYYQQYQTYLSTNKQIENFNAAVDDLVRKDGVSAEDAFSEVINRPEYQNLVQYWAEPTAMPEETAQKYQKTATDGFSTYTDLDSYNADQKKAAAANAKRNAMDFRVSVADYKQYQARRAENERWVAETEKYRRIQDNATKWMVAPATTAEEKKEQKAAIDTYINAFGGNPEAVANMQWYFDLVNHGVPADIAITGNAETIGEWSSANVSDPKEWASLYLAAHGYAKEDGAYYFIADAVETTRKTSTSADFAATAEFDPRLLTKGANFTPANGVTLSSAADAAYAVINGVSGVRLNKNVDTGSEEYATYAAVLSGDAYKQMTDEERGTFNTLFRKSHSGAMNYLYRLSFVLQDRAHATNTPNLASGMSEEDIANQIYDQLYYLEELNYRATPGTFNSRMAEAMNRYQGMTDEELEAYAEKLLRDVSMTYSSPDINEKIDAYEADYDNAIRVLNRRKQMREEAKVLASLSGYTDEDGASATKTVNQTVKDRTPEASSLEWGSNYADPSEPDALQKSKYAKIVNNAYQDYSAVHFGSGDSAYMTHLLINRQGETEHEVSFEMTSEQKNKFNWLLLNKGEDAADAYYEAIRSGLEDKSAARLRDEWYGWANDSGWARFGASALSSLALPATGLSSLGGTLLNAITGTKTTKAQATRWDLTGGLRDAVQEDFSDAGKFWYGTGMSTVDSGLAALLNVATESNIGEIMLASGAYASTLRTALDRGLDSDRATATALAAGIVEIITEHVGLETLVNGIKSLGRGASKGVWKEFLINTAKQILFEGSEEAAADILNLAADGIINGDMSEFDQNVSNYIQAGYTKSEAQSLAWRDFIKQTLLSFAGGAISGGFMAGVGGGFKTVFKYVNDRAFAPITGQEKVQNTSAVISTTPADVPISSEHFTQYEKGKGIVNSIFGDEIASGVEKAVGSKSVSDERITSVLQGIDNLNNTDYLYQYTHDSEGNLSISGDERVALATALASLEQSVDASKVDAAFIKAMASQQTAEQRGNNANPRNIVASQKLREYRNNIDNYRSAINNKVGDVQTRLATAQSRVDALNAQKQIAYENGDMETYYELSKPNGALSAALEELGKWQSKLDAINNGSDMEIRQNRQQIERMQSLIDGHFASLADAIDRYAPASFDNGEIARANAKKRIDTLGAQIDAMLGSDILSDETIEEQRGILSEQVAELRSELKRIDARINSADPTALSRLMTSANNGTVGDFIAEQDGLRRSDAGTTRNVSQTEAGSREASSEALAESAESANTEQAGESTAAQSNAGDSGVESVKQGDANEHEQNQKNRKETPKVVVNIGKTIQQRFDRIAKKFGLEIVWTSRGEIDGNGMYNRKEPNKIYLATDMLSPTGIAKEMVVAREFFTHEVVHYVANTKAYQRLSLYALQYYTQRDGEEAVNRALNGILDEERAHGKNAGPAYAVEEMTALFAQEVLFSGESGNKNALTWLTRTDGKYVSSMLTWLQYLIKRGNVRRMKDGAAIKTLLLDAEYALTAAISERKRLDAAGLSSAFETKVDESMSQRYNNTDETQEAQNGERGNQEDTAGRTDAGGERDSVGEGLEVIRRGSSERGAYRQADSEGHSRLVTREISERLKKNGAGNFSLVEVSDKQSFVNALDQMRKDNSEGGAVDPKTAEELKEAKAFLTDDGAAGVAVEPNGNITAVFKNKKISGAKNAAVDLIFTAINNGGDRLDCYGKVLVNNYARAGMIPVARVAYSREYGSPEMNSFIDEQRSNGNQNFAKDPDVYVMKLAPNYSIEKAIDDFANERTHYYTQAELDALPLMDYDEALAYRDGLIEQESGSPDVRDDDVKHSRGNTMSLYMSAVAKQKNLDIDDYLSVKAKQQGLSLDDYKAHIKNIDRLRNLNGYTIPDYGKIGGGSFARQFNEWKSKRVSSKILEQLYLGTLSSAYAQVGAKNPMVWMPGSKLIKTMADHSDALSENDIPNLDKIIKDPMIIMESKDELGNPVLAVFSDVYGKDGLPVFAIIDPNLVIDPYHAKVPIDASVLISAYTKQSRDRSNPSGAMQYVLDSAAKNNNILWVNPDENRTQDWLKRNRLLLPSRVKLGLNKRISKESSFVKPPKQTSGSDSLQDLKGIADHDAKHSRGMNFSDYANAGESGKYEPIDWSKNKILQADGTPYPVLYSGSKSVGHTVFNPEYADDGLTTWLTNSIGVAQSYAREKSDSPLAPEFFPLFHDNRKRIGTLASYYDTNSKDNNALYDLLNKQARGDFSMLVDEIEYYSKVDPDVISEWGDVAFDIQFGLDEAASLLLMIERIATNHSELDENNFYDLFYSFSDIVDSLEEDAYNDVVLQRGMIDSQDYYNGNVKHDGESVSFHVSELARFRTAVEDAIVDSDIFDVLRKSDRSKKHLLGFDSMYKGNASLFSDEEASSRLPIYSEKNGIYKLRPYGENPLIIETSGAWNMIDLNQIPEPVQKRLARLYGWAIGYSTRDIARAAFEQGYDSVVYRDIVDIGSAGNDAIFSDVIATFNPYQQKSIYNTNPTMNPDIMHSRGMTMDDYIARYGQKPQNAFGQANDIRTAERVDDDKGRTYRVSDAAQTLKQVPTIRQNVRDAIDDGIIGQADGLFDRRGLVYEPVTLDRMREMGSDYIAEHGGLDQSMKDLTRDMPDARSSELTKYMSAANQVFTEIGSQGVFDPQAYYEFVASYVEMRSNWGRVGRAMQLVNDSPLGRQVYWERVVQRMNEKNREATDKGLNRLFYRGGYQDIVIPQALYANLAAAQTQEEINAAQYAITEYIGMHSPLTVSEALRNWRYFSMLANPVTHMRNILGNVAMQGGVIAKDAIASGLENIAVRAGWMDANDRTHSVVFAQDPATRQYIEDLYQENAAAIQSGGRDGFKQQISDAKPKALLRWLSQLMSFNTNMLEREDALFLHMTFNKAAAQYMKARGIDANNITRQQRADIVQYATQQAQEATYRDASKLADALNQFAKSGWMQQLVVESVMPFKKTPINIAKRGLSYSPLGLARSLVHLAQNVISTSRGGDLRVSATKLCDELAQGITGTMLSALGFLLSRLGILKLSAGNGDKDKTFASDIGHQSYSLEIGDVSIKIEQLAPLTFPLFMGAALEHAAFGEEDGLTVSDMADAALSIADPLMDMSFMSSLNSTLETYDSSGVMGVFKNMLTSYAGQYLPTIGSKVNSFVNRTRRTTKGSQASPIGAGGDYTLRSYASKVPGLNQAVLEPYVKTTGEYDTKDFGKYLLSFMNNFVSPVNVQIMDTTPVNTELERLVQATGQSDFVPQNPKKYLTIGNSRYNMTAKEYTEYSKEHNETVYASLSAAIGSSAYANATDDQRVQMLEKAYNRAHKSIMDKYKIVFNQK